VKALCLAEEIAMQGNRDWYNSNPGLTQQAIQQLIKLKQLGEDAITYIRKYAVANHDSVKKEALQSLEFVATVDEHNKHLQELPGDEKKRRQIIEPKPETSSFRDTVTRNFNKAKNLVMSSKTDKEKKT